MTSKKAICIAIKEVNKVLNGINKRLIKCNNLFVEDDYKYYNSPENLQKALDKQRLYIIVVRTLKSIEQDLERLEKLEKVIEILKKKMTIEINIETQEEYELLKEVFKNERME